MIKLCFCLVLIFVSLLSKGQIDTGLFNAIKKCDIHAIEKLVESGIDINGVDENGANALMWAAHECELPLIKFLLSKGAQIPEKGIIYLADGITYYSNLQGIAADKSKVEVLIYLADSLHLSLHESGNKNDKIIKFDWTPFHYALSNERLDVMKIVLEKSGFGTNKNADKYLSQLENWIKSDVKFKSAKEKLDLDQFIVDLGKEFYGEHNSNYALTLLIMGNLLYPTGQYNRIMELYETGLSIYSNTGIQEDIQYAIYLNNLGSMYKEFARYKEALPYVEEGAGIYYKLKGEDSYYASMITNLGELYSILGDYDKNITLLQQAIKIRKKIPGEKDPMYAISLYNLSHAYSELGMLDRSLPLCKQALSIFKNAVSEENPDYVFMLSNYGGMLRLNGQTDSALLVFNNVIKLSNKVLGEDHPHYANSLYELALTQMDKGDNEEALNLLNQSFVIDKKVLGEEHNAAGILINQAIIYGRKRDYTKAKELLFNALAIWQKTLGKDHINNASPLKELSLLHAVTKKIDSAYFYASMVSDMQLNHISRLYPTLSEYEKINLLQSTADHFYYLPSLALLKQDNSVNIQMFENELKLKGIVLHNQRTIINELKTINDSVVLNVYERWKQSKEFIAKQYALAENKRSEKLDSVEMEIEQLEKALSRTSRGIRYQTEISTIHDVKKHIEQDEAIIEFMRFKVMRIDKKDSIMYAALVMKKDRLAPEFIPLFEEKELVKLLGHSNAIPSVSKTISSLYNNNIKNRGLYELIWKPLEHSLGSSRKIYYVPVGILHRIAFPAIQQDGQPLIEKYALFQLLSSRSLATVSEQELKPVNASLWGDIQYDSESLNEMSETVRGIQAENNPMGSLLDILSEVSRGDAWQPLPGTKQEIDKLGALLKEKNVKIKSVSQKDATESEFKRLNGKSPELLHVATHGFSLPRKRQGMIKSSDNVYSIQSNPMFRSGLILAGGNAAWKGQNKPDQEEDGILTAFELAQLDLSNTKLVVLSACETALGDVQEYEGVIGLQRALKMAGVKQMLLTLWQVPDKPTMELMILFYRNWLNGQTTREALRDAQLELKKKYPSPYYWGGFVLVE